MSFKLELDSIEFKIPESDLITTIKGFKLDSDNMSAEEIANVLKSITTHVSNTIQGLSGNENEQENIEYPSLYDQSHYPQQNSFNQGPPAGFNNNFPQQPYGQPYNGPMIPRPSQGHFPPVAPPINPSSPNQIIYKGRGFDSFEEFQKFMSDGQED